MINKEELLLTKVFGSTHLLSLNVFLFFWLAQISTHASVNFYFFFYVCRPLKGVIVPVVRSEDRGNWDKYLGVTKAMQGRLMRKIQSFSRTCRSTNSIPWKSRLFWNKWILQWLKKRKRKKNMVRLCKLSLYANEYCDDHAVYFRRWLKWRAMLIQLLITFRRKKIFYRR